VEQGEAQRLANGFDWLYSVTVNNASITGTKIVVKASDLPGNTSDSTVNL